MKRSKLVQKQLDRANSLLENDRLDQKEKAIVCTMIENLLMDAGCYHGYNNTFWIQEGSRMWMEMGKPEYDYRNSDFFGPEFNRTYF